MSMDHEQDGADGDTKTVPLTAEKLEEKISEGVYSFFKTPDDTTTDLIKSICRNVMSGDLDERFYDGARRVQRDLIDGKSVRDGMQGTRDAGSATRYFAGQRVKAGLEGLPIFRSGKEPGYADVGSGLIAARGLLYIFKSINDQGRWTWQNVKRIADDRGDKQMVEVVEKALATDVAGAGGELIPTIVGDIIGMLHGTTVLRELDPVMLAFDGSDTIELPRGSSGASASWVGQTGTVNASTPSTDRVLLSEKTLRARVIQSNRFVRHAPPGADEMIRDDLRKEVRDAEELAFLRSAGSQNEPMGLRFLMDSGNRDVDRTQGGTQSTIPEIMGDLAQLAENVHGADANGDHVSFERGAYVMQERTVRGLEIATDGNDNLSTFAEMIARRQFGGARIGVTSQLPEDLDVDSSGNTDHTEAYYVEMSEFVIADGVEAQIKQYMEATVTDGSGSTVNLADTNQQALDILQTTDTALKHGKAASNLKNVDWGADYLNE